MTFYDWFTTWTYLPIVWLSEIADSSIITLLSPLSNISIAWVCYQLMATLFWRKGNWISFLCSLHFPFFSITEHWLYIRHHLHIWQVSPQLSCVDTCPIWTWFKRSNRHFSETNNASKRDIYERSFSYSHPWSSQWITRYIKVAIELTRKSHPLELQSVWCWHIACSRYDKEHKCGVIMIIFHI